MQNISILLGKSFTMFFSGSTCDHLRGRWTQNGYSRSAILKFEVGFCGGFLILLKYLNYQSIFTKK